MTMDQLKIAIAAIEPENGEGYFARVYFGPHHIDGALYEPGQGLLRLSVGREGTTADSKYAQVKISAITAIERVE